MEFGIAKPLNLNCIFEKASLLSICIFNVVLQISQIDNLKRNKQRFLFYFLAQSRKVLQN